MEHIPTLIFDWIETHRFESLEKEQQQEVLIYFSKNEYDELHLAAVSTQNHLEEMLDVNPVIEQKLMKSFEQKFSHHPKKSILFYSIQLWKVAALFFLIGGGTLWVVLQAKAHKEISYVTIKDTVYVPSFTGTENLIKVYDTVYINSGAQKTAKKETRHRIEMSTSHQKETTAFVPSSIPGIHLLSIKDKDELVNKQKGNSLKDDTLLKQFKVVRL